MATAPAPLKAPPPAIGARMPTPPAQPATLKHVSFGSVKATAGHKVAIYAPGGWGKTRLAVHAPGPVAVIDLDDSLPILWPQFKALGITDNIKPVDGIATWNDLIATMNASGWDGIKTVVIDTLTKAEELCTAEVIRSVPHEKGGKVERIEDYGFGKGFSHIYDMFMPLLSSIERHCREGRNVVMICHECSATFPNPMGQDYLRYEPRLQSPNSGKASIRLRVREFVDHLLFGAYDIATDKDGKGIGSGSRTIYPKEMPYCMAKSRTMSEPMSYDDNAAEIWNTILGVN